MTPDTSSTPPGSHGDGSSQPLVTEVSVTTAFAAGWQMADVFAMTQAARASRRGDTADGATGLRAAADPSQPPAEAAPRQGEPGEGLASARSLPRRDQRKLLIGQLQSEVSRLRADFARAGVPETVAGHLDKFDDQAQALLEKAGDVAGVRRAHADVQLALTSADPRLGKAYDLGHDVAETCLLPHDEASFDAAFGARLVDIDESLADLASNLPDHSSRAVSLSLRTWEQWAANPKLSGEPLTWPNAGVKAALHRQGEVWRSILSGEKLGKDMLDAADYVGASKALLGRLVKSRSWIWGIVVVGGLLLVGLVALLIAFNTTLSKVGAGVLSVLGAVGISASTLRRKIGGVGAELEAQLWGAELDWAIAQAITVAPGDWRVKLKKVDLPARGRDPNAAGNAASLDKLRSAVGAGRERDVLMLLHKKCLCRIIDEERLQQRRDVAGWIVKQAFLSASQAQMVGARQGTLISEHKTERDPRFFVWTFRRGKISQLRECRGTEASQWAGLPADAYSSPAPAAAEDHEPESRTEVARGKGADGRKPR